MNRLLRLAAATAAICGCGLCHADDSTPPPQGPWAGEVSAGYVRTSGNTNSTTLNFKGDVDWHVAPWENKFNGQGTLARNDGKSSAESYQAGDKLAYDITDKAYVFAKLGYLSDRFAGIVETYSESVGLGRRFIHSDTQELDLDLGLGASQQRPAGTHHLNNQLIGVFDGLYSWKISDNATFKQALHVEAGQENTFVNPVTELKLTIVGNLFATFDYEVRYNTTVPAGTVHTDTITTFNLGYSFGKQGT